MIVNRETGEIGPASHEQYALGLFMDQGGLPVFQGVTYEDHVEGWNALRTSADRHKWGAAAICASFDRKVGGRPRYGEERSNTDIQAFCKEISIAPSEFSHLSRTHSIFTAKTVGFEPNSLTFTHYLLAAKLADDPHVAVTVAHDEDMKVPRFRAWIMDQKRDRQRLLAAAEAERSLPPDTFGVLETSCADLLAGLEDNSVDLIFTDPPYHDATLHVYDDLAKAARVLKDGASLITYISHHRLPEILKMLQTGGLTFFWPLAMKHTGQLARMTEYGIVVHWKPLLWFVKGPFRRRPITTFVDDYIESEREKETHPWQQGTVEATYYIEQLTHPGDLVVDPFCGGGTTAVAAKATGRRWLTGDIDHSSVVLSRERLWKADAAIRGKGDDAAR